MIGWLIETMFAVTLLMLLVLALRRPVAYLFGAGWAYALWLLPVLRIILPPFHLFGGGIPSLPMPVPAVVSSGAAAAPLASAGAATNWEPLLLAAWLGGAALILLWQSWSYLSFARRLGIGSKLHSSLAQDIGVMESTEVDGPLAIGLLDRWIVVPADFTTRYTPQEQRLALLHEHIHHRRQDIFCNMIALGVLALNWFNPIAYFAFRAFRADQELSCDAVVAACASGEERHDYALALVKSSSRPGLIAACPLNHAGQLKQRLRMMKAHRSTRLRAAGGFSAVTLILLVGISVTEAASVASPAALPNPTFVKPVPSARPQALPPVVQAPNYRPDSAAVSRRPERTVRRQPAALVSVAKAAVAPVPDMLPSSTGEESVGAADRPLSRVVFIRTVPGAFLDGAVNVPIASELRGELRMIKVEHPVPAAIKEKLQQILAARNLGGAGIPVQFIQLEKVQEN